MRLPFIHRNIVEYFLSLLRGRGDSRTLGTGTRKRRAFLRPRFPGRRRRSPSGDRGSHQSIEEREGSRTRSVRYAVARATGSASAAEPWSDPPRCGGRDGRPGALTATRLPGRAFPLHLRGKGRPGQVMPKARLGPAMRLGFRPRCVSRARRRRRRDIAETAPMAPAVGAIRRPGGVEAAPGGRSRARRPTVGSRARTASRSCGRPGGRGAASIAVLDSRGPMHQRGAPQRGPAAFSCRSRRRLRRRQERSFRGARRSGSSGSDAPDASTLNTADSPDSTQISWDIASATATSCGKVGPPHLPARGISTV